MRIVHLAFEDHRCPGSGGGGFRTHEINRRLATSHQITVVTARYPGARRRIEDGVEYRPVGVYVGRLTSVVTYFLMAPIVAALHRGDLVVEDFAAPISSALVPLFTRRPTVAVVQWLFARERSRHYRLPLFLFEDAGVRLHRRFVAVSQHMADRIQVANRKATVEVVHGGVALPPDPPRSTMVPGRVLYLGRMEWRPKGLDLLLETFGKLSAGTDARLVLAGDGPDRGRVSDAVRRTGLEERVDLVGRVSGRAKWQLLSSATVVAIPSRHESFGLVAAEATAAGTPVVAFDLPALREILAESGGLLVPPYDTDAFATALCRVITDPVLRTTLAEQGPCRAQRYDWDHAAQAHERFYEAAVLAGR
jgi:glycosyltransferase involved in cell wall biosynthesis